MSCKHESTIKFKHSFHKSSERQIVGQDELNDVPDGEERENKEREYQNCTECGTLITPVSKLFPELTRVLFFGEQALITSNLGWRERGEGLIILL